MPTRGRNNLTEERIFFVTTTVVRFLNVFKDNNACDILINNIKYYQKLYNYTIQAYVIMPSHFHWIVLTDPVYGTISDIMRDIKRNSSKEITEYLKDNSKYRYIFEQEAVLYKNQVMKFWMRRFDDEVIRNEKMFWEKLIYIHNNPVKKELVLKPEDYRYSSARNYVNGDDSILTVDTEYAGIRKL